MNINELLETLKSKYDYCDELLLLISKVVPALIYIYGEEKKRFNI